MWISFPRLRLESTAAHRNKLHLFVLLSLVNTFASAFTDPQTRTVCILRIPNRAPEVVLRTTSHLDVAPTMLQLLGTTSKPGGYAQGFSLFEARPRPYLSVGAWADGALITPDMRITYALEEDRMTDFEVRRTSDYGAVSDLDVQLAKYRPLLEAEALRLRELSRPAATSPGDRPPSQGSGRRSP